MKDLNIILFARTNWTIKKDSKFIFDFSILAYLDNNKPVFIEAKVLNFDSHNKLTEYVQQTSLDFFGLDIEEIKTIHFQEC